MDQILFRIERRYPRNEVGQMTEVRRQIVDYRSRITDNPLSSARGHTFFLDQRSLFGLEIHGFMRPR